MCIIRVSKKINSKFAQIDNKCFETPLLSWKAKGLLGYLLSKPDDWKIRLNDLIQSSADGREAVRSGIKELEKQGYIVRHVTRDKLGRFHTDYTVYEVSQLKDQKNEMENKPDGDTAKKIAKTVETRPSVAQNADTNSKEALPELKPDNSTKKDEFIKMLEVVENVADKKAIMETLKSAMKRGVVKNPKAYLAGIIKKYQNGEFTPVGAGVEKNLPVQKPGNGRPVSQVIKHCPHCDNDGMLSGHILNDGESHIKRRFSSSCSHNKKSIDDFINRNHGKLLEIYTSDDDEYRFPPGHQLANQEMIRRHGLALEKRGKAKKAEKPIEELGGKNNGSGGVFRRIGDLLK